MKMKKGFFENISVICTCVLAAGLALTLVAKAAAETYDSQSTQVLALELEYALATDVINHNIAGFSAKISNIFQGQNQGGFTDRDSLILQYTNSGITDFVFTKFFATRDRDVIVIAYNVEGTGRDSLTYDSNIISVWQKVRHGCCRKDLNDHLPNFRRVGSSSELNLDEWLLVSQTNINDKS